MQKQGLRVAAWSGIFLLMLCVSCFADDTVGFINLKKLLYDSQVGKEAIQDYMALRQKKEKAIAAKQKEFNDLKQALDQGGSKMKDSERAEKMDRLRKLGREYERMVEDAKKDLQDEDRELINVVFSKADRALKIVAQKKGYAIILKDPNAMGYLDPRVDITADVIKELNRQK